MEDVKDATMEVPSWTFDVWPSVWHFFASPRLSNFTIFGVAPTYHDTSKEFSSKEFLLTNQIEEIAQSSRSPHWPQWIHHIHLSSVSEFSSEDRTVDVEGAKLSSLTCRNFENTNPRFPVSHGRLSRPQCSPTHLAIAKFDDLKKFQKWKLHVLGISHCLVLIFGFGDL